ncbi:hypothetical protein DPO11_28985 [Salmonella enterica]|nr:hypothetical protein [Salmonella enterica]
MSDYGVRIYHADGTYFDFNERTTLCCVLGGGETPNRPNVGAVKLDHVENFNTGIHVPEGYDWWLWHAISVQPQIGMILGFVNWGIWGFSEATAYLDSSRNINIKWTLTDATEGTGWIIMNGHERYVGKWLQLPATEFGVVTWPVSSKRDYGIGIYGADTMSGVFDTSKVSYLLWKGEVDIYSGWGPGNINPALNMNNCLCFFYNTDPNLCIGIDHAGKYKLWKDCHPYAGKARVKVCIFGNDNVIPARSEYGIEIWNPDTGKLVYNSGRDALIKPQLVSMSQSVDMKLEDNVATLYRSPVKTPGIRRPMYAPTNIGAGTGGFVYDDENKLMNIFYMWVSSDGYALRPAFGGQTYQTERVTQAKYSAYRHAMYKAGSNPVMVIDAEDYFLFPK